MKLLEKFPNLQVWVGIVIIVGFSVFAIHQSESNADDAREAAKIATERADKVTIALKEANDRFCEAAIPSFNLRLSLIDDINAPTILAAGIDPESEVGKALQAQINRNNEAKEARKVKRIEENGPRPQC